MSERESLEAEGNLSKDIDNKTITRFRRLHPLFTYGLWAWQILGILQTCIAESTNVLIPCTDRGWLTC